MNSSGRCPNEFGRDRPYAAMTVTATLSAVPTRVMPVLTITDRVTTPPENRSVYAPNVMPWGTMTRPPAAATEACVEMLVSTTT